ncbi:hypothetical protein, partial [Acinetobacter baumannii]|uniref:hypothetical protein n=1 Tax=Acinetobacter baumannii TaxID=470 RepID=UPI003398AE02
LRLVAFHCHVISIERVEVDPRKTEAMKNYPRLFTAIDIMSFLGLAGYYQRFFNGFKSNVFPLTALTEMSKKFEFLKAC